MKRLWITGYRSYELGAFKSNDPKIAVIKFVLRANLIQAIEDGYDWVITGGQMGIEQWSAEVANDLKQAYPNEFKVAVMLPFAEFGNRWNEQNQLQLSKLKAQVDFSATISNQSYQSPQQLRNYQEFMLKHTDGALMIYDEENQGKSQYDYQAITDYKLKHDYAFKTIDFDDLQEAANEYQENQNNSSQS